MSDTTPMYVIMCGGKFFKFVDAPRPDTLNNTNLLLVDTENNATHFTDKPIANWIASKICQVLQSDVALDSSYNTPFVVPISTKDRTLAKYYAYRDKQFKDDVDLVRIDDKIVGDIVRIGGINWRVVDRREEYCDYITMTFCSEAILHNRVPFVMPSWDKHFVLTNPCPVNYKTSYVNSLCKSLCDHMDRAFKVGNQSSMLITDPETGEFVHVPTKNQLEGEFAYFKSAKNRKGLNFNGIATPYWTATMSMLDCVYFVNEAGNIYRQYSPNYPNGFRPCFKIAFLKYQSIEPTVKVV